MIPIRTNWEGHEFSSSGRTKRLRDILRARREGLRVTRGELGVAIASYMNARSVSLGLKEKASKAPHDNTLYSWETLQRHPSIDKMSAWAAVLGYQLHVLLSVDGEKPVLLWSDGAAHVARTIDDWPPDLQAIIIDMVDQVDASRS